MSFDGNAGLNKKQTFNKKEKEKEKQTVNQWEIY
jgi:hypothetical protein